MANGVTNSACFHNNLTCFGTFLRTNVSNLRLGGTRQIADALGIQPQKDYT